MPATILILGGSDDEHAAFMFEHLRGRGADVEYLDSRSFPGQLKISFDPLNHCGYLVLPSGRSVDFSQIRSIYWRNYYGVSVPEPLDEETAFVAENDARGLFESLFFELRTRWVNGWEGFRLHQTKPVQLARVAALGVRLPPTLLTNEPAALLTFAQQHRRSIFKPVQGGDQARRLTAEYLNPESLDNLRLAPITVQTEVPGTNIRVFVAGPRVFAIEIRAVELDYREDLAPELLVHRLPPDIENLSRQIAHTLSLLWTGIDFRLTPEGEYVFLEANPSPMFIGFQEQTGLPLADSLADLLTGEED